MNPVTSIKESEETISAALRKLWMMAQRGPDAANNTKSFIWQEKERIARKQEVDHEEVRLLKSKHDHAGELRLFNSISKREYGNGEKWAKEVQRLGLAISIAFNALEDGEPKSGLISRIEMLARKVCGVAFDARERLVSPSDGMVDDSRSRELVAAEFMLSQLLIQRDGVRSPQDEERSPEVLASALYDWMCEWFDVTTAGDRAGIARLAFSIPSARHVLSVIYENSLRMSEDGGRKGGRSRGNVKP